MIEVNLKESNAKRMYVNGIINFNNIPSEKLDILVGELEHCIFSIDKNNENHRRKGDDNSEM